MRVISIIITICFFAIRLSAQQNLNSEKSDSTNIYAYSLKKYFGESYGKMKIIVEQNDFLFPFLRYDFDTTNLLFVDYPALSKMKAGTTFYRIVPLKIGEKNNMYVTVISFDIKRAKKGMAFVNRGGAKIFFKFDCTKEKISYDHDEVITP